jgi:autotransporter-associated beta strand protein
MKSKTNPLSSSLLGLSRLLVGGFCAGTLAFAPSAWAETATYNTPGTVIWTVPANVNAVTIECRGGGGAGGAAVSETTATSNNANIRGGGGAGGNFARKVNLVVSEGEQYEVTVGAGGISPADGAFVQGNQLPEQTGGSSSFKKVGEPVAAALATGGIGGKNGVRLTTNTGPNQGGGAASTDGSIGDTIVSGGSGGGASSGGTGAGGGGAGNTSAGGNGGSGPFGAGAGGVSGGGLGAAGTTSLSFPGGDGTAGAAPGGGGSGSARNTNSAIFKIPGGAGGAGGVLLTWTVDAGTTKYAVTSTNSSEAVGAIFDVTITAQDGSNNTVTADTNVITMSSPTSGSLMEFDWNADGTFGDNSGTLVNGVKTIKARNKKAQTADIVASAGLVTTPLPLSITTTLGAFSRLQLLAPGETAAPGTDTGKTGTPTGYGVGTEFNVTVNAVDEFWNFIDTVTDTVSITSSTDGIAILPADAPLDTGTVVLPVTLNTPGLQTLTASDFDDPLKTANTSPDIPVTAIGRTWAGTESNVWDTVTANWFGGLLFEDLHAVTFGNAGAGFIDLNGATVAPFSMLVNATSADYEFANGTISGMAGGLTKAQAGTLVFDTTNTYTGPTIVNGGLLHLKNANALPATSALTLNTGILGLEGGNFTRSLGTAPGQVVLTAEKGGFAAFGVDCFVNLGGAGAQVTWGTGGFFNAGGEMTLGHASASNTIDFQNPINIAGVNRLITVPDGGAEVDAIISGAITNSGAATHFAKSGDGTLMLTGVNAWGNELRINAGTVMLGGSTGTVIADTSNVQLGAGGTGSAVTFDLNGRSETILNLNLGGQNTSTPPGVGGNQHTVINSGAAAVLTINGLTYFTPANPADFQNGQATVSADINTGTGNKNFNINNSLYDDGNGPLAEEVIISGALTGTSITKLLTGTLVLTNPLNSGNTTVGAGSLIIRKTGTQTNANPNNDTSTVTIAAGAVLNLDYTGTDTVAGLVIGTDPPVASGTYGSADFPEIITGDGTLTVVADPFLTWAGNNPAVLFDGDANNDGVKNGLAWLLGAANPTANASGLLPAVSQTAGSLKMTFKMLPASARDGAQLFVQHSSDLGISDPWSTGVLVPDTTGGAAPVTFTISGTNPLDVVIDISSSEAAGGKLFGRLRAER